MARVRMQFAAGLGHLLAPHRRERSFDVDSAQHASVKHAIEALGVPHTEVGLVRVDGRPVGLDHLLRVGESVSVDAPRAPDDAGRSPTDEPRFVADAHLGRLARYLRFLGVDTLQRNPWDDGELVAIARAERRIVLTRDRALLMRRDVDRGAWLRATDPLAQLREVVERFGIDRSRAPAARCLLCNAVLEPVDPAGVGARLPPAVRARHTRFWRCPACERIFWRGSHWQRLRERVDATLADGGAPAAHGHGR